MHPNDLFRTRPARVWAAASAALVLLATTAGAQTPAAERDTLPPQVLDTLSVRILRSPALLRRAPFAVSVVEEREIRRARPDLALDQTLEAVPGVQVDNRYNYALGERISIRGAGARAPFGVRGVRVLVDGIPATLPDGQTTLNHVDPGALGRAEILRGPASALYGNGSGGVVRLSTEEPPDAPLALRQRVTGGPDGFLRTQTTLGGRAGAASYVAGVTRLATDGFRAHGSAENLLARAALGWARNGLDVRWSLFAVQYDALNPGSLTDSLLRVDRRQAFARNRLQQTGEAGTQLQTGVQLRHPLGPGVAEVAAHVTRRALDNPIPTVVIDLDRWAGGARAEYASSDSAAGRFRWRVGGEVARQDDDRLNYANVAGARGALRLDQREEVDFAAVFGGVQIPAGPGEVTGAVRYDDYRFEATDRIRTPGGVGNSGQRRMGEASWSVGASAPVRAATLYANVSTAFETPTTTELVNRPSGAGGFNPELDPQRTLSGEVGVRGSIARWLRYEGAAYRARVTDALIPFEVPAVPDRQFFRNAGSVRNQGAEAGIVAVLGRGARVRGAYTWTDARFRRYVVAGDTLDGNRVPGVTPHVLHLQAGWTSPAGPFVDLTVRRLSSVIVDDPNRHRSPGYSVLDVRFGTEARPVGPARIAAFATVANALDAEHNASVVVNAVGRRYFEPAPGRTLYLGGEIALGERPR